jgi:hypothetical protein
MFTLNLREYDYCGFRSFARYQEHRTSRRIPARGCRRVLRIDSRYFGRSRCDAVTRWCVARAVAANGGHYARGASKHRQKGAAGIGHRR